MYRLIEDAELDEEQEQKLERELAREYHLITRDDRLDKVAEDIVRHFIGRGFRGKAHGRLHRQADGGADVRQGEGQWAKHEDELKKSLAQGHAGRTGRHPRHA